MARRFDLVAYLKLVRFPLVFTAIADGAAGYFIGVAPDYKITPTLGLLALTSAGLYLFGMALNDIADLEKDRQGAPNKVMPSGRVSRGGAIASAGALLAISFSALCFIPGPTLAGRLLIWGCVLLAILAYDLHWVKAPPVMGLVRAFNFLLGIFAVVKIGFDGGFDGAHPWKCAAVAVPIFLYGTSLTYVSTLEDAALDRKKLMFGTVGMILGALLAGIVIPAIAVLLRHQPDTWHSGYSLGAAWILVGWIVFRARKARDRKGLMLMVRDGVAGYILVDAALVLSVGEPTGGLMIAALLLPAMVSLAVFKKLA